MSEKDFPCDLAGKKESEGKNRKKNGDGAPLIGAIIRENSNLAYRAPSKIVNCPAKNWQTKVNF